jgi:hypothetical protein
MDITDALAKSKEGEHDLLVRVYDPSESAHIVLGKQRMEEPKDKIFYFGVQGIWGDVWMEPVCTLHHSCALSNNASNYCSAIRADLEVHAPLRYSEW